MDCAWLADKEVNIMTTEIDYALMAGRAYQATNDFIVHDLHQAMLRDSRGHLQNLCGAVNEAMFEVRRVL